MTVKFPNDNVNGDWERWNTHFSTVVELELFGVPMRLRQDPNSQHLGTTFWDASIVMAKFFEKNAKRGEWSRVKVRGKRAVELGSGMGLAGLAFALLGGSVVLSDVGEVLPLLQLNYVNNLSLAALRAADSPWADSVGEVLVSELDWEQPQQRDALKPPYDFVLAADCVYSEKLVAPLLDTVLALTSHKSVVLIANELRSESVHKEFLEQFGRHFSIKSVPGSKQDPLYQHPLIHLLVMKRKRNKAAVAGQPPSSSESLPTSTSLPPDLKVETCMLDVEEGESTASAAALPLPVSGSGIPLSDGGQASGSGTGTPGAAAAPLPVASPPSAKLAAAAMKGSVCPGGEGTAAAAAAAEGGGGAREWQSRRLGVELAALLGQLEVPTQP